MQTEINSFLKFKSISEEIHGWCLPEALATWDAFLCWQKKQNIVGNYLEIGVWRGKTAAMLLRHADLEKEKIVLIDLKIQKDELQKNLAKVSPTFNNVSFHELSSWGLQHNEIAGAPFKWIHIDGKHTGDAVYNDLKIADKFLSHNGIVCIDDFFEIQYPQISQAVFRYLDNNPYSFAFFLCGYKKAYLARVEFVKNYLDFCYKELVSALEERGALVTLSKTSYISDLNCFSTVPRYANLILRGPDWDKNNIDV